jgi:hypothetical protein
MFDDVVAVEGATRLVPAQFRGDALPHVGLESD